MDGKTRKKEKNDDGILLSLSLVLAQCDPDTAGHCLRVGEGAKLVMEEYVRLFSPDLEYGPLVMQWAATLHDIGKAKVPLRIIMKPTKLSNEEFVTMRKHTIFGEQMLSEYFDPKNRTMMKCAHDSILYHHERIDGYGYPSKLFGEEIPLSAQFTGLADCFDALVSVRAYKPAFSVEKACEMILNGECGKFSPELLACLPALAKNRVEAPRG